MQILFFIFGVFLQWTLEVLGAGGAIWGMSEVWHLRGDTANEPYQSNDDFRIPANIVFVLGFIRMFFRYSHGTNLKTAIVDPQNWLKGKGEGPPTSDAATKLGEFIGFLLGFFLQWVLECLGAGGASWGMSEVWKLRAGKTDDPSGTNHDFRWVANTIFVIGLFRMAQKYCPDHNVHTAMNAPHAWFQELTNPKVKEIQMQAVAGAQATSNDGL